MKLKDLTDEIAVEQFNGSWDIEIAGISYDSRKIKPGNAFVCIEGYRTDGHQYVLDAEKKGASVIIAQKPVVSALPVLYTEDTRLALAQMAKRFYRNPAKNFKLIGITGTNGKTTVTYLIKSILEKQGYTVGLIGTNQNMIGTQVLPSEHTTPESLELYAMFAEMASRGAQYVVMEVSSHALELKRVGGCEFETAVFTNLTQDHLDFHGDMESYFQAKQRLFSMCRKAVINTDDIYGKRLAAAAECELLSYGVDSDADITASNLNISARGVTFGIEYQKRGYLARLGIPGKFSVYNALAAVGAAISMGISLKNATDGLAGAHGVKGRAEVLPTGTSYTVMIDYAHSPDGLKNILSTIREFAGGRIITVFGCGGDRDRTKRPLMGQMAAKLSDFLIVTSDNPRSEDPEAIIRDILPGVEKENCDFVQITSRRDAIAYALRMAQPHDIILLAGKGHETYQILKDKTIHFDEREVVAQLLAEMDKTK